MSAPGSSRCPLCTSQAPATSRAIAGSASRDAARHRVHRRGCPRARPRRPPAARPRSSASSRRHDHLPDRLGVQLHVEGRLGCDLQVARQAPWAIGDGRVVFGQDPQTLVAPGGVGREFVALDQRDLRAPRRASSQAHAAPITPPPMISTSGMTGAYRPASQAVASWYAVRLDSPITGVASTMWSPSVCSTT